MTPKKMFFVMLGGLALVIVGSSLAYVHTSNQLKAKSDNLSQLKAEIDSIDDSTQDVQQVLAQYEDLSFIDDIASEVLPPEKVQSDLVSEIYALANEAGVTIRTLSFVSPEGTPTSDPSLTQTEPLEGVPGVFVLSANLSYETSDYSNFIALLGNFEDNRRKLQIARLNVNPQVDTASGQVTGYQGTLEINVYVRP